MFKIGDMVIYGGNGVCVVDDISTIDVEGIPKDKLYYILSPVGRSGSVIYAPTENCRVVMRKILDKTQADELIAAIPDIEPLPEINDKSRENIYREYIKSCDCQNLIRIIKTLYLKGKNRVDAGKKISILDDRYLKQAEENLYAELSIPLGIPKEEMSRYIFDKVEAAGK